MTKDLSLDRELARRARLGEEASWRQIYDATCDRLFALLCYQVGDRDLARDLLQETFLHAFRRLESYRGDGPLAAWLRAIAMNKALDWKRVWIRRLKRTVGLTDNLVVSIAEGPSVHFDSERNALQNALARLSARQRAALLLREWEERSFAEIAELLGCTESTARVHHARARQRVRRSLNVGTASFERKGWEGQQS